jgi:PadR family transcriptional regulator PadR
VGDSPVTTGLTNGQSRFELAPPRRFLLPAILLLLSEEPGYGYSLIKKLQTFRFGRVDGPSVYRALAQLETDGLIESSSEAAGSGHERRVYQLTGQGERILRAWMGVIKQERDHLETVLRRYRATGTIDAVLADVEGGWTAALGSVWSSVSSTSLSYRLPSGGASKPFAAIESSTRNEDLGGSDRSAGVNRAAAEPAPTGAPIPARFVVVPDRSVILIEARSSVGPISFGAVGLTGWVEATLDGCAVSIATQPTAHLQIEVEGLRSGNRLYDAELQRRIDARRFPVASIDLRETTISGADDRYRLSGELTLHGVTRSAQGTVTTTVASNGRLVITGEQTVDIRDFSIASPTVLMLRIYPDVRVRLHVEAEPENGSDEALPSAPDR